MTEFQNDCLPLPHPLLPFNLLAGDELAETPKMLVNALPFETTSCVNKAQLKDSVPSSVSDGSVGSGALVTLAP